jgi:hypothetical protein
MTLKSNNCYAHDLAQCEVVLRAGSTWVLEAIAGGPALRG